MSGITPPDGFRRAAIRVVSAPLFLPLPMPLEIDLRANFKHLQSGLSDFQRKQFPFALAQTLTGLARIVQDEERDNIQHTFLSPTPFTVSSVGSTGARKLRPVATVFVKDIAAAYLSPYVFGGVHRLPGRALLNPKDIPLNRFGQLPRGTLAKLKGDPDVFIGSVTFRKSGQTVSGVWRRPPAGQRFRKGKSTGYGSKGNTQNNVGGVRTGLTLLIRFGDALPVREHLDWFERAERAVAKHFRPEFAKAFAHAMRTAKP